MIVAVETKTVKPSRLLRRAEKSHPGQKLSKELSLPIPRIINEILAAEDEAAAVVLGSNAGFSTAVDGKANEEFAIKVLHAFFIWLYRMRCIAPCIRTCDSPKKLSVTITCPEI
jgi:hypothetical protein